MNTRVTLYALISVCLTACIAEPPEKNALTMTTGLEVSAQLPGTDQRIDAMGKQRGQMTVKDDSQANQPAQRKPTPRISEHREGDQAAPASGPPGSRVEEEKLFRAKTEPSNVASQSRPVPGRDEYRPAATGHVVSTPQMQDIRPTREPLYHERYARPVDHTVMRVSEQPVSTFSIDVDTGAYANVRRWLNQGQLPPEDAVRVEEFINYFDYDYPGPERAGTPFAVHTELAPTPWNPQTQLLRIGVQGYQLDKSAMPPSNLVFLLDVSGSMQSADKLPLLKQSLGLLTQSLDHRDRISIVVYAGASGVVLNPTQGHNKGAILAALQQLEAGGSTNGAAGIELAYQLAQQHYVPNGVNRVILATDGDFNVGLASTTELIDMVGRKREAGIALTTLGFGSGNFNDHLLEQLADEGNGNYAYIDCLSEARKVLAEELTATLVTIAKDVKIQVEFNPATVSEYRLIGYENRHLDEADFNNDQVDAGEIGAGHRVTALYEISLVGTGYQRLPERRYGASGDTTERRAALAPLAGELAHLRVRYKLPGDSASSLVEVPILRQSALFTYQQASDSFRFAAAVAAFGQKLRGGQYLERWDYPQIAELARDARGADRHGYRSEFLQLVALADSLDPALPLAQAMIEQ